jgi:phosphatidylethanolamine-binding protein (PEBP) family uncharacterized protein
MGNKFDRQERSGMTGTRRPAPLTSLVACLLAAAAIAGCGGGSSKSASAAATTTAATAPSTTPAQTTTAPSAAKADTGSSKSTKPERGFGKIKVTSTAFKPGGPIPVKYTCDGAGTSPPLEWQGVPRGTAEMLLLAIDLSGSSGDAIQWAVAGISPSTTGIPEGSLPAGAVAGVNSAGKVGWGGICGAKGQLHHVGFLFYALNRKLGLKSGFNPGELRGGLKSATLATGLTLATYQRQ